jgi:hypothetical protein
MNSFSPVPQQWKLTGRRGGYFAAGVNDPITGQGGGILLIDHPVKNADQAASPIQQESIGEWYQGTAYPRLLHEAHQEHLCYQEDIKRALAQDRMLVEISDWASKLPGTAARIAGLPYVFATLEEEAPKIAQSARRR